MTERKTILCAGGAVQDIVMRVEHFPAPGAKIQASDVVTTIGGQAGNAAVALAHLGARVRYAGPIGSAEDAVASFVQAALEREGIYCAGLIRVPGGTSSLSLILVDAIGEKTVTTRRGIGLNRVAPSDADAVVAGCDAVLLDNRYPDFALPVAMAAQARASSRPVTSTVASVSAFGRTLIVMSVIAASGPHDPARSLHRS